MANASALPLEPRKPLGERTGVPVDIRIRRNEICAVGLPRCDYVFSSTRCCFIAYGFDDSSLEMSLLRAILEAKGVEPIEAGGALAPGQNAFCQKICSKIITSQFCIVLLNNSEDDGRESPNANVNMEYGLMIGFNKYVIPFQKESQKLPFNVAGLDTIKYTARNFKERAERAVEQAIRETTQPEAILPKQLPNYVVEGFLVRKRAVVTAMDQEGDRSIFRLGEPLGFNLLNDFSGMQYTFFGNFTAMRSEAVIWRTSTLVEILNERKSSIPDRVVAGLIRAELGAHLESLISRMQIWLLVASEEDKASVVQATQDLAYAVKVFSPDDVSRELMTGA